MDLISIAYNFTYIIHEGSEWGPSSIFMEKELITNNKTLTGIMADIIQER